MAELNTKSAIWPAGSWGLRHFRQSICPAKHGWRRASRRRNRYFARSLPGIRVGRLSSMTGSPALIQWRTVFRWTFRVRATSSIV